MGSPCNARAALGFAPRSAKSYAKVTREFEMTGAEKAVLGRHGFVQLEGGKPPARPAHTEVYPAPVAKAGAGAGRQ